MLNLISVLLMSYLVGSIPTSIMYSKGVHGFDIRTKGSGNAGGTNVFRILGWKAGIFVGIIDVLKGVVAATLVARLFWESSLPFDNTTPIDDFTVVQLMCGAAAILGHIWTVFAGFRGGKGVATAAGMLIGITPTESLVAISVFALVIFFFGYVSLGSMFAAISFPTTLFVRRNIFGEQIDSYNTLIVFGIVLALLLIFSHRQNIKRLLAGTENRISRFRKKKLADS